MFAYILFRQVLTQVHRLCIINASHLFSLSLPVLAILMFLTASPTHAQQNPAVVGQFSALYPWPSEAIHTHLLPNGKVLTWDEEAPNGNNYQQGTTLTYIVNIPPDGAPGAVATAIDSHTLLFCSGHTFLTDGRLAVIGGQDQGLDYGDKDTDFFDYRTNTWSSGPTMANGRWYGTATTLANGEIMANAGWVTPGSNGWPVDNQVPEVTTGGKASWVELTGATRGWGLYPRSFLAPNGDVIVVGPAPVTRYIDTSGAGTVITVGRTIFGQRYAGSAVMYDVGKILIVGGANPATNTAEILDLKASKPAWQSTGSMSYARQYLNATILADGTVLATGGTAGGLIGTNNVLPSEIWTPATGLWTVVASLPHQRLYHSTATLLSDGRVLSAGGITGAPGGKGIETDPVYKDAEIYSPPYLFNGPRPTITAAPQSVAYGETFIVTTPDAASIANVNWIRLSSTTHGFNMNQRLRHVRFTPTSDGSGLTVSAPLNPNTCPPGHYLMFILNGLGVPSVASIIHISSTTESVPAKTPAG